MNEREIERLLKAYGESVPPCAVPALQPKPLRWPRFAAAGIATAAVAGIAVVGLWPRDAVAGSIARLHQALSDAKTMEYTMSMKIPSGWHPYLHAYFENGIWQFDAQMGTNLECSVVERDGMELIDYKALDHASLDLAPASDDPSDKWQTALDFAKKSIDTGDSDIRRSVKIHDHDPIDGHPAYEITMERPSERYVAKILVDKQTNLPIESSVVTDDRRPGFGDVPQQIRTVFQFNKPIDPKIFDLYRKNRVVIRMNDARDRIQQMWRTPLGSVDGAELRAATVTRDGTLWLATTAEGDRPVLPDALTDTVGRRYVRAADLAPSNQTGVEAYDKIFGKPIYVTAFAPLPDSSPKLMGSRIDVSTAIQDPAPASAVEPVRQYVIRGGAGHKRGTARDLAQIVLQVQPVTIQFSGRDPSFVNPGRLLEAEVDRREILTVIPTRENGDLPSYFPLLSLDRPNFSPAQSIWRAKAQVLESAKQYRSAAEAYGQLAKARYDWVKYSAFQPMLDEARCYRLIGETRRAEQLTEAATALKASRER